MMTRCVILHIFVVTTVCSFHFSASMTYSSHRIMSQISLPPFLSPEAAVPFSQPIPRENPPIMEFVPPSPSPNPTISSSQKLNVLSFGAVGDGVTDDTQAFNMAWHSACQSDSAVLHVPNHYTFLIQSTIFTGPCKSRIIFQIDGTILAPNGPEMWAKENSKRQWMVFYRINGLLMEGGGVIDGRGLKWWNLPCKPHRGINGTTALGPCDSPVVSVVYDDAAMRFFMSSNLTVKWLRIRNSPQFHFRFDNCRSVNIDSIHIKAPSLSPNTDGIHIENTNDVNIFNSVVSNGDDCVSIGAGSYNVHITNITCGPSHGISIGSLGNRNSRACVSNITVLNSIIKNSANGVRIKTWQGGSGSVSQVTFKNIHMDRVRNPIMIDQYYCLTKGCANQTSAVFISDILYENVRGTYDARSPPMHLACSDAIPCTNLTFSNVNLLPAVPGRNIKLDPYCWNAYGDLKTITIPSVFCLLGGNPQSFPQYDIDGC